MRAAGAAAQRGEYANKRSLDCFKASRLAKTRVDFILHKVTHRNTVILLDKAMGNPLENEPIC